MTKMTVDRKAEEKEPRRWAGKGDGRSKEIKRIAAAQKLAQYVVCGVKHGGNVVKEKGKMVGHTIILRTDNRRR